MKLATSITVIAVFLLSFGSSIAVASCESTTSTVQTPTSQLPDRPTLLTLGDGSHEFQGKPTSTGLILSYYDARVMSFPDLPRWSQPPAPSGYSLHTCAPLNSTGNGVKCVYLAYFTKTCPTFYTLSMSSGACNLSDSAGCQAANPSLCLDGLPPDLLNYPGCQRPRLRQCDDGTIIEEEGDLTCPEDTPPPAQCSDFLSCYDLALSESSCDGATNFDFQYDDPLNWSFECSQIAEESPDHPDNGGDGDGNPYDDPETPTTTLDPAPLAELIGETLRPEFGVVERSIRDSSTENTTQLQSVKNSVDSVELAVRDSIGSGDVNAGNITNAIEMLGAKMDTANALNSGPCDPRSSDYYSCLNNPMNALPAHSQTESGATTISDVNTNFLNRISQAPVVVAFTGIANLIHVEDSQCPEFSIDLRGTIINEVIETQIHCSLMATVRPILSTLMIIVYIFIAFRIFASA